MAKPLIFAGLLIVAVGGALIFNSRSDSSAAKPSIAENLENSKKQEKIDVNVPAVKSKEDRPVASKTGPWPKFVAENRTYSFGRMDIDGKDTHSFKIRNDGEADLELKAGETTCKCTQFAFEAEDSETQKTAIVKPGESIRLIISWKGGGIANRSFSHGGDVYSNDPKEPMLKFGVEGSVEAPFEVLPNIWNFGHIYDGDAGNLNGTIASRLYDELVIESVVSPSGLVKATWKPLTVEEKARDQFICGSKVMLELSSELKVGVFEEEVSVKIAQRKEPIKVQVSARKHGTIRLQQMAGANFDSENLMLQMGSFPASEGREAKVLLIVDEKGMTEPFKITETTADPSFLKGSLEPLGEPTGTVHRYILTISAPPGRPHAQRVLTKPGFVKLGTNLPSGEPIHFQILMYSN